MSSSAICGTVLPFSRSLRISLTTSANLRGFSATGSETFFTLLAVYSLLRTGMEMARLFILKNNTKTFIDIPTNELTDYQAQIELSGATVYHATVLPKPSRRTKAKLRKRLY